MFVRGQTDEIVVHGKRTFWSASLGIDMVVFLRGVRRVGGLVV